jgi:predicted Zn-dependent protease
MSFTPNALYFSRTLPATGLPCRVDGSPTELNIELLDSKGETVPLERLAVKSGGFDQDHLVLSWTIDGEEHRVYTKDTAVIHALKTSTHLDVSRHTHESMKGAARARQSTRVWIWAAVASIIAVLSGLWVASDVLVRMAVNRIPIEWERTLGESARQQMLTGQRVVTEGPAVKVVEEITRRLTDHVPGSPYRFDVTVVKNDAVNAMALPGGSVIVYTGLLKQAESPEEVAGVLAHEINHVLLRHGLESMVQSVGVMALAMVLLGNQQGLIGALERLGIELTTMKFSREKETEADLEGLHLLHQAHISPAGMIEFFERLAKMEGAPVALLSTHPMSAERAARLKEEEEVLPADTPAVLAFDWQGMKDGL